MGRITLYYRNSDDSVEEIKTKVRALAKSYDLPLVDLCLDDDKELANLYNDETPALQIGPYRLKGPFDEKDIQVAIASYLEREKVHPEKAAENAKREAQMFRVSSGDKFSYWLTKNYTLFIAGILAIFLFIPFMAPVLMKNGHERGARVIYKTYSFLCHELAYRSFFFFGEQPYYPRALAGIPGLITYEEMSGKSPSDTLFAREFHGNEIVGYKVAICERDVAIYGSMIIGILVFHFSKKKLKQLPWYLWVIFAIIPIALDGGSQLFSLGGTWPAWFPIRESTPMLRILTGAMFGLGTVWYVFPMMEESMITTRSAMARKMAIKKKLSAAGAP